MTALDTQVGGNHYKHFKIQPVEFIHKNGIGFIEGNIIKYICRWRDRGGVESLEKIKHYVDLLIELERAGYINETPRKLVDPQATRTSDSESALAGIRDHAYALQKDQHEFYRRNQQPPFSSEGPYSDGPPDRMKT